VKSMRRDVAPHPTPGDDPHIDLWRVLVRHGIDGKDVARHFRGTRDRRAIRAQRLEIIRRMAGTSASIRRANRLSRVAREMRGIGPRR